MRLVIILLTLAGGLFGQCQSYPSNMPRYNVIKETSLSSAAEKVTVQQPATGALAVAMECADIYCSVACEITLQQNGTAATATAMTQGVCGSNPCTSGLVPVGTSKVSTALAYSGSNVGTGSVGKSYYIPAAGLLVLDLRDITLPGGSTGGSNFSIGTNSITGTVRIQIQYVHPN